MVKSDLNSCNYKINYKSKKPEIETSIKTHVTCDVLSSCYVLQFDINEHDDESSNAAF